MYDVYLQNFDPVISENLEKVLKELIQLRFGVQKLR